jgi:site-specific DNA-methyltransferase (adenine-specific)
VKPYYADELVTLYLDDCREVLSALRVTADLIVTDPPYAETSLEWDRWPEGWLAIAASVTRSMWCFGSLRMFGERWREYAAASWKLSHDTEHEWIDHAVWEKHNGSGIHGDRFRRVHEIAAHWYRGPWSSLYHDENAISEKSATRRQRITRGGTPHLRTDGQAGEYGETVLMRSVIRVHSMHGRAIHPTEKPLGILDPLISYACPPGGLVVDPFAGSGSTLDAARTAGRHVIGVELHEPYAEKAARRLSQQILGGTVPEAGVIPLPEPIQPVMFGLESALPPRASAVTAT